MGNDHVTSYFLIRVHSNVEQKIKTTQEKEKRFIKIASRIFMTFLTDVSSSIDPGSPKKKKNSGILKISVNGIEIKIFEVAKVLKCVFINSGVKSKNNVYHTVNKVQNSFTDALILNLIDRVVYSRTSI